MVDNGNDYSVKTRVCTFIRTVLILEFLKSNIPSIATAGDFISIKNASKYLK